MTLRSRIIHATLLAGMFGFAIHSHAADRVGVVCVNSIPTGERWDANDTGASERSVFTVQIDQRTPIQISTNSSGVFTNLSFGKRHSVRILLDGKPLASFRFTFQEPGGDHMRLWYKPFYGTWSLTPVWKGERCGCSRPQSPKRAGTPQAYSS